MSDPAATLEKTLLTVADFEVIPLPRVVEKAEHIPAGATVSVTASPTRGMNPTIDVVLELQAKGYRPVPHVAARLVEDRRQLSSIIKRLDDAGVGQVFVVGGDGPPHGDYHDALSLLEDMAGAGHPFLEVGIAGYPEGHPKIPAQILHRALLDKQPHATYIVTQMCFEPETIVRWAAELRADGIALPIRVGVPGAVEPSRLLSIGAKIGVGESMRYLAKSRGGILRLVRPGRYHPDRLISKLARIGSSLALEGIHLFTFNQVEATVEWHRRAKERAGL
jgi:methylenetetrahydrofolate reductase (NADPH)